MLTVRPLDDSTWEAFASLVEGEGGVWGGCWCIGFHLDPKGPKGQCKPYRETKQRLVNEGKGLAALVFEGEIAVGWCQFGRTDDLPNIKNRKNYEAKVAQSVDRMVKEHWITESDGKKIKAEAAGK